LLVADRERLEPRVAGLARPDRQILGQDAAVLDVVVLEAGQRMIVGRVSLSSAHVPGFDSDVSSCGLELAVPAELGP